MSARSAILNDLPRKNLSGQLIMLLLVFPVLCAFGRWAEAKYAGGTGEPNDPYQIATAEDLMLLGDSPEDYDRDFILTADIDLDPNLPGRKIFDKAVIAPELTYSDLEVFGGTPFSGYFDGQDHVISNLQIQGNRYLGLFGRLEIGAMIANLGLEAFDVNGEDSLIGGLVGDNSGSIMMSYSTGVANGSATVGGLVGFSDGNIQSSYSTGMVGGKYSHIGGLVGWNSGNIESSHSSSVVSTDGYDTGGLVGMNYGSGSISSSYSTGTVIGRCSVGGLVGCNQTGDSPSRTEADSNEKERSITASYSTSMVIGDYYVGGLVGENRRGFIIASYSTGAVSGDRFVGGLVGDNDDSIRASYSTGQVSGNEYIGGLVGSSFNEEIIDSFWDIQTSGLQISDGGIGLMTAQMQDIQTFLDVGWDFVDETENGTEDIWWMPEDDYPRLWWELSD
jgi:hypothetical protein